MKAILPVQNASLLGHKKDLARSSASPVIQLDQAPDTSAPFKLASGLLFWTLIVVVFLGVFGAPVVLACSRTAPRGPVNCVKQTRLLGAIPLPQERIDDVRSARVSASRDSEGDAVYWVELLTPNGAVPLTIHTSGGHAKDKVAGEINAFVSSGALETLTVTEPGLFSVENVVCMLIWLPFAALLSFIWQGLQSRLRGAKSK